METTMYSNEGAAEFTGRHIQTIKYHARRAKLGRASMLVPDQWLDGKRPLYTEATLREYMERAERFKSRGPTPKQQAD